MSELCRTLPSFALVLITGVPVFGQSASELPASESVADTTAVEERDHPEYICEPAGVWGPAMSYAVGLSEPGIVYGIDYDGDPPPITHFATVQMWWGATDGQYTDEFFASSGDSLYKIRPRQRVAILVGPYNAAYSIMELGYKEPGGVLYGTDHANLYVINVETGAATLIGPMEENGAAVGTFTSMDYHEARGKLYAVADATDPAPDKLYEVNMDNGSLTEVGPTNTPSDLWDIWYDRQTGNLYAVQNPAYNGDQFYIINPNTGNATAQPNTNFGLPLSGLGDAGCSWVPAVSEWALMVMALLVLTAGTVVLGRRRCAAA